MWIELDDKKGLGSYHREYLRGELTATTTDKRKNRGWHMQQIYEDNIH